MIESIEILETERRLAAVIHLEIARETIQREMKPAIDEVLAALADQGLSPVGPMFAHHLTQSATRFDFEVGFPVALQVQEVGRVKSGWLPGTTVARAVYQGPYEGLFDAWEEFGNLLEVEGELQNRGLRRGHTLWEIYAVGPEASEDAATWRTELYLPLVAED